MHVDSPSPLIRFNRESELWDQDTKALIQNRLWFTLGSMIHAVRGVVVNLNRAKKHLVTSTIGVFCADGRLMIVTAHHVSPQSAILCACNRLRDRLSHEPSIPA
jgi:hypothetical protein